MYRMLASGHFIVDRACIPLRLLVLFDGIEIFATLATAAQDTRITLNSTQLLASLKVVFCLRWKAAKAATHLCKDVN